MDRRRFLKAMGAIAAGVGLRAVPVLGETYSELVPPKVYAAAVGPPPGFLLGMSRRLGVAPDPRAYVLHPSDWTPIKVTANWLPVTDRLLADKSALHGLIEQRVLFGLDLAANRPAAFARIEGI
jgi:hypothetical protein